jgi:hypothetical protein
MHKPLVARLGLITAALALGLVACGGGSGGGSGTSVTTTTASPEDTAAISQFAALEADTTQPSAADKRMAALLLEQIRHACSGYSLTRAATEAIDLARQLHQKGQPLGYFDAARTWLDEIGSEPGAGLDCHHAALVILVTT